MGGRGAAAAGAGVVFLIALLVRLPFGSEYLWAWDSVLYARALEDFDVSAGRPHPPGYLFYVLSARVAAFLTGDANAGLVLVSIVAGAATFAVGGLVALRQIANARVRQVVLFDDGVRVHSKTSIRTVTLSGGVELQYLPMRARSVLLLGDAVRVDEDAN